MDKIFTLLSLQRQAQEAESLESLAHIFVNETVKIIPYRQALFWLSDGDDVTLKTVSGNSSLDTYSPAMADLKNQIKTTLISPDQIKPYDSIIKIQIADNEKNDIILVLFQTPQDGLLGGLYLERDKEFQQADYHILSELALSYTQALTVYQLRRQTIWLQMRLWFKKMKFPILAFCLVILLWPVRLTITAPAEIVAQNPTIITTPFHGVLKDVHVDPGDIIQKDSIIASMDSLLLTSTLTNKQQELEIAKQRLAQLRREVLSNSEKKQDLQRLQSDIALKDIEYAYAKQQVFLADIRAPHDGIAIFSDKNSLRGQPMQTGDPIMTIAEPRQSELLIRVPSDAMIPLKTDADIRFFLNVSPLKGHDAMIKSVGYQASADPDGLLSYKIYARLDDDIDNVRIGWKGTAKIYGDRVIFAYKILRRPLVMIRNLFGI